MDARIMMMAGGTGGHVFPALAVADELKHRGADVSWLGTPSSFEARVVPEHGYELDMINIRGLRGNGLLRWVVAPFQLMRAVVQAGRIIRQRKPSLVVGMGGFASGPGGLVAKLFGVPLVIHEQNALPGMTNRWLSKIATRVLEAFPGSFKRATGVVTTGNPIRQNILQVSKSDNRKKDAEQPLNLLIIGGSLGAKILNEVVPVALAELPPGIRPKVIHQAGKNKERETIVLYKKSGVTAEVTAFVSDMAEAYSKADIVVCRAGALTIAELATAGVPSILVPFPHAVDDHQTFNAHYLSDAGAAILMAQSTMSATVLAEELVRLIGNRQLLKSMSQKAKALALNGATQHVADICEEVIANEQR